MELVDIDKMQYGFMPSRGIFDTVFILKRLTEKYQSKGKKLFYVFVDLKKAVDQVLQKMIWSALRKEVSQSTSRYHIIRHGL